MGNLSEIMKAQELTIADVAARTGVTTRAVYLWLAGSRKVPNYVWLLLGKAV